MSNPYKILGVESTTTVEEIKKAYRRLAMKHHPDRGGGDETEFKKIQEAYDRIQKGDTAQQDGWTSWTTSDFGRDAFVDMLRRAAAQQHAQQQKPRVSLTVQVPLKDAILGTTQFLSIPINNKYENVRVGIPAGLRNGEAIRYPDLVGNIDVTIHYRIQANPIWKIDELDLIKKQSVSIWTLIAGGTLDVDLIDGSSVRLKIPPRTQPNTMMRIKGKGMKMRENQMYQGDMFVQLDGKIPDDIPPELLSIIEGIAS